METMNLHYTIVISRMEENQRVHMGQELRPLLRKERRKENTAWYNTTEVRVLGGTLI